MLTVKQKTGILLIACLPVAILSLSGPNTAVLRVWAPNIRSPQGDNTRPLMDRLEAITGRKATLNSSNDVDALLQACATHKVDHSILAGDDAEKVLKNCEVEVIAIATVDISLFVKTVHQDLNQLKKIGYIARTASRRIALKELNIDRLESKLVEYPNHRQAVFALFQDEIDALIINDTVISHLTDTLKDQVTKQMEFNQQGRVYFFVAPELDANLKQQLQNYYLSDDPVIKKLFYEQAGLHTIRPAPSSLANTRSE